MKWHPEKRLGEKNWPTKRAFPKVVKLESRLPCFHALRKMGVEVGEEVVLVNPSEVVGCMKRVPPGRLTTIVEICKHLAAKHHVHGCCTLTTGIFITIAAHAAEEAKADGMDLEIPYWRTLKADGYLNEKFPGGAETPKALLEKEGFQVVRAGSRWRVENYQTYLVDQF